MLRRRSCLLMLEEVLLVPEVREVSERSERKEERMSACVCPRSQGSERRNRKEDTGGCDPDHRSQEQPTSLLWTEYYMQLQKKSHGIGSLNRVARRSGEITGDHEQVLRVSAAQGALQEL